MKSAHPASMAKRFIYFWLLIGWVGVAIGQTVSWEPIRQAAERERAAHDTPSIVIGVIDKTGLVWSTAVGHTTDEHSPPPTVHTLYRVGSIPKRPEMRESAVRATPEVRARLARAEIAPIDASRFTAPLYDPPIGSGDSVYTSTEDVARFVSALLNKSQSTAFDIGFVSSTLGDHRRVSHDGATYGYSSDLEIFPDDGFAVFVAGAMADMGHGTQRLAEFVARSVFAARANEPAPQYEMSEGLAAELARNLQGHYITADKRSLDARIVDGKLYVEAPGVIAELRRLGDRYVLDDLGVYVPDVGADPAAGTIRLGDLTYRRTTWEKPSAPSAEFAGLIGDYGAEYYYVRVYERDSQLYMRRGFTRHERLQRIAPDTYRVTNEDGTQVGEPIRFTRSRPGTGTANALNLSGHVFKRRDFGAEADAQTRANALHTKDLRKQALAATPPKETTPSRTPHLVELTGLDPGMHLDIRYATENNFMGMRMYEEPRAFLQRDAAEALVRAHRALAEQGFGILVHDAYRPWYVTKMFWDATPESGRDYVADPAKGSRHNRGCAADITLYELATGKTVQMTGRYDETSARSSPLYLGGTSLERWHRDLLKSVVEAQGFAVYTYEWWHFDYTGWEQYPIMNEPFDKISR